MKHVNWDEAEVEEMNPLLARQIVVGNNLMMVRMRMKKGCIVPLHHHVHEQMCFVQEGQLKFLLGASEFEVKKNGIVCIPSEVPHKVEALADSVVFDIFNPPREDFLNKSDAYLRR
ncbi:MAG: cupin domain-containing protein [Terriglobia bacterium]